MNRPTSTTSNGARAAALRLIPRSVRERLRKRWPQLNAPPVGMVRFGALRRLTPIGPAFGLGRGLPIDRYYIDDFFRRHTGAPGYASGVVRGRVLEIGDDSYTRQLADPNRLEHVDVLDVSAENPRATVIADLSDASEIPSASYDCVICTQTLLYTFDLRAAVATLARVLRPEGVLLLTVPGICRITRPEMDLWGDYWRFTSASVRRLLEESFAPEDVVVDGYGNVLASIAFLHGLCAADLKREELDLRDPNYELVVCARAIRRESAPSRPPSQAADAQHEDGGSDPESRPGEV